MATIHTKYHEEGPTPVIDNIKLEERKDGSLDIIVNAHARGKDPNSIEKVKFYTNQQEKPIGIKEKCSISESGKKNWVFNYKNEGTQPVSFYIVVEDTKGNFIKSDYFQSIGTSEGLEQKQESSTTTSNLEKHIEESTTKVKEYVFQKKGAEIKILLNGKQVKGKNISIEGEGKLTYLIEQQHLKKLKLGVNAFREDFHWIRMGPGYEHGEYGERDISKKEINILSDIIQGKQTKGGYRIDVNLHPKDSFIILLEAEYSPDHFTRTNPLIITPAVNGDNPPSVSLDFDPETNELIINSEDTGENAGLFVYKLMKNGTPVKAGDLQLSKKDITKVSLYDIRRRFDEKTSDFSVQIIDKSGKIALSNTLKIGYENFQFYVLENDIKKTTLENLAKDEQYRLYFHDGGNWNLIGPQTNSLIVNARTTIASKFNRKNKIIKVYKNGKLIDFNNDEDEWFNFETDYHRYPCSEIYHLEWEDFQGNNLRSKDIIVHYRYNFWGGDNAPELLFGYNKKKNSLIILTEDTGYNATIEDINIFQNGKLIKRIHNGQEETVYFEHKLSFEEGLQTFHVCVEDEGHHKVISKPITLKNQNGKTELIEGKKTNSYKRIDLPFFDPFYLNKYYLDGGIGLSLALIGLIGCKFIRKYFRNRGLKKQVTDTLEEPIEEALSEEEKTIPQSVTTPPKKLSRRPKDFWEIMEEIQGKDDEKPPKPRW